MKEFGYLKGYEENRYWQIKLSKFNFLIGGSSWLYRLCWHILTLFMVIPLFLIARYYSVKLRLNNKGAEEDVSVPYQYFTNIYPGCVYSPLLKGYELELFLNCDIDEPVLEIGIGDGYFSSLLFSLKNKKLTYGSDLIYETIKSATKYNHCENYLVMDALEIPLPNNCLGTVIMNNLMHHLSDRSLVLNEVLRVLRIGGRFIFTDNNIGWGVFTWEQLLLRKLNLNAIAEKILRFKLKLFAQQLLVDDSYYDKKSKEGNFKIIRKMNFGSKTSTYLSSIFEFLNLKQGQPTREEMIRWTNLFRIKNKIDRYMKEIIEYCCVMEKRLREKEGYACQFFEIEKMGEVGLDIVHEYDSIQYVCPKCKKTVRAVNDSYFCSHCRIKYAVVDGIPFFISYQDKLEGLYSYIENKRKERGKEYIT